MFATAKYPTPILNTPDFHEIFGGHDGCSLPFDEQGLLRAVETVALPQTKFQLLEKCEEYIFRVKTKDYVGENLFVDQRFLLPASEKTPERESTLPLPEKILETLQKQVGISYVWGGNWVGIPEMLHFYPPAKALDEKTLIAWTFQGLDCSGLLYLATDGYTPRNTSKLVNFGKSLPIQGRSPQEIQRLVKPLDIIVWKGHVLMVLNPDQTIESRAGFGVVVCNFISRMEEILEVHKKTPLSSWQPDAAGFVINRWVSS